MKKLIIVSFILAAFAISCEDVTVHNNNVQTVEITTITAESNSDSEQTRTLLDEGMKTNWIAGDAINVFFGASESGVFTTEDSGDIAQFKGYISVVTGGGEGLTDETSLWGVYPYSKDTKCDGTNIIYTLPSIQASKADSFADDLFPQIAKSKNFYMSFYNLCGLIRFKVASEDIVKVTIKGKNEEPLAGTALVGMDDVPFVKEITDSKSELEMSAPDGECFNTDAYYYFVLYPTNFTEGLTITYYKENSSASYDISTYNLARNKCASITDKDRGLTFNDDDSGTGDEEPDDELLIPVSTIILNKQSLDLYVGDKATLTATVRPADATYDKLTWTSESPAIVDVDEFGIITALSPGTTNVKVTAGDVTTPCIIRVSAPAVAYADYVDEYGVNHGKGIAIGKAVWAPVNCGYHAEDYKYGKLYQWGRKYGQGYSGELYVNKVKTNTEVSDATVPITSDGGVSIQGGQHSSNSNVFYRGVRNYSNDWVYPRNNYMWNSGTESSPIKTDYDPCPDGWRVPTQLEIKELKTNHSEWSVGPNNQEGYWMSGLSELKDGVAKIFLPAAGERYAQELDETSHSVLRGKYGAYWSSSSYPVYSNGTNVYYSYGFTFDFEWGYDLTYEFRNNGYSIRCVQE